MAVQNFLSGGFVGKLGAVVGQRWRNKRTIRVHVPHNNSNTPKQQVTRNFFRIANQLAHIAMNYNRGHSSWQTPDNNEWSLRVGTAMRRLLAGLSEQESIPFFPDNWINPNLINGTIPTITNHFGNLNITNSAFTFNNLTTMDFTYNVYDISSETQITKTISKTFNQGDSFSLDIPNDGTFIFLNGTQIEGDNSNYGATSETLITLLPQTLFQVLPFDVTIPISFATPSFNQASREVSIQLTLANKLLNNFTIPIVYKNWSWNDILQTKTYNAVFTAGSPLTLSDVLPFDIFNRFLAGSEIVELNHQINGIYFNTVFTSSPIAYVQPQEPLPLGANSVVLDILNINDTSGIFIIYLLPTLEQNQSFGIWLDCIDARTGEISTLKIQGLSTISINTRSYIRFNLPQNYYLPIFANTLKIFTIPNGIDDDFYGVDLSLSNSTLSIVKDGSNNSFSYTPSTGIVTFTLQVSPFNLTPLGGSININIFDDEEGDYMIAEFPITSAYINSGILWINANIGINADIKDNSQAEANLIYPSSGTTVLAFILEDLDVYL